MKEPKKLEKAACTYFINSYNQRNDTNFKIIKLGDKPDCEVKDCKSNQIRGIEITHLFYDGEEAKMMLGRSNKKIHNGMNSKDLIRRFNKQLNNKINEASSYDFQYKMILVFRVASPIFDRSTFDMFEKEIIVPQNIYDEIWLLFYDYSKQTFKDLKPLKYNKCH